ncbi:MAG: hypothetical protein JWQ35_1456 [Bacteriovoracaceae bacterium]|nr:hypothetical protein [Bacteriovoracaceae bacterium]
MSNQGISFRYQTPLLTLIYSGFLGLAGCGSANVTPAAKPTGINPIQASTVNTIAGNLLDFGGMYSTGNTTIPNPLTSGATCPSGFTSYQIFGNTTSTNGMTDQNVFLCARTSTSNPIAAFGGMYSTGSGSSAYINPITGTQGCPTSFSQTQILGNSGDNPLFYCYADLSTSVSITENYAFGGMYGDHWNLTSFPNAEASYSNPATGNGSCPAGFQASLVYGTVLKDFPIFVCLQATNGANPLPASPATFISVGVGLTGNYYSGINPGVGTPVLTRIDPTITFDWTSAVAGVVPAGQNFSAAWTGHIVVPTTDNYTFRVVVDDSAQVSINGHVVLSCPSPATCTSSPINLVAGQFYTIAINFVGLGYPNFIHLTSASTSQPTQVPIPSTQLFPN